MRNKNVDWDDSYDYSPNELVELDKNNPKLYREVVESNLSEEDTVEKWEQRNLERAKEFLENKMMNTFETLFTIYLISLSVSIFGCIRFEEDMEEWLPDYGLSMKEMYIVSLIPIINTVYAIFVVGEILDEIRFYLIILQIRMIVNYIKLKILFIKLFKIKV